MRIRTANGRLLAVGRLWAVLVIGMVLIGGHAFGQQKQSGTISSKKGSTAPERRTIVPLPDGRFMNNTPPEYRLPEVPVEAPRNDNPSPPLNGGGWSPPPFVLPGMPNAPNSGILPGPLPSPGALPPSESPMIDQHGFCICKWTASVSSVSFPPCPNQATETTNFTLNYSAKVWTPVNDHKPLNIICFTGEVLTWSLNHEVKWNDGCGGVSIVYYTLYGSGASVPRRCAGL
jgi:hypothetical protein